MAITKEQAIDIRTRDAELRAWMGKRNSYHPSELPAHIKPPTNEERSACEVFEFVDNPPDRYFLYVKFTDASDMHGIVATWMGDKLGTCELGCIYRDNFGGKRQSITVHAINGCTYYGTYFRSAGDYARVRKAK